MMVDEAREKELEVSMNLHSYMAGCTLMSSFVPQWDFEGTIGDFTDDLPGKILERQGLNT